MIKIAITAIIVTGAVIALNMTLQACSPATQPEQVAPAPEKPSTIVHQYERDGFFKTVEHFCDKGRAVYLYTASNGRGGIAVVSNAAECQGGE